MTSKIHRATVTQADLHYVGSITVDADLLDAADLLPGERVDICDCTNGSRLSTYVIPGERGSGRICVNGAAAHLVSPGDVVILIAYSQMSDGRGPHLPASRGLRGRGQPGRGTRQRARSGPPGLRRRPPPGAAVLRTAPGRLSCTFFLQSSIIKGRPSSPASRGADSEGATAQARGDRKGGARAEVGTCPGP